MSKYCFCVVDENVKAEDFLNALADEGCVEVRLHDCVIEGKVDIAESGIVLNVNGNHYIGKPVGCDECTFKERADFSKAVFGGEVDFSSTQFGDVANFKEVEFGEETNFSKAKFGGEAFFRGAKFSEMASFSEAVFSKAYFGGTTYGEMASFREVEFSEKAIFNGAKFSGEAFFRGAKFSEPAIFGDIEYRRDTFFHYLHQTPTEFYLDSQYIDEVYNPSFKRYVADQQFIRDFRENHRILAFIWWLSSDYGRSFGLWAFWSVLFAFLFSVVYRFVFQDCFVFTPDSGQSISWGGFMYYSVVTFTTLGFGDIVPLNHFWARFFVTFEVILGYVMLGGLISILANKLARRS